ncbi:phosphotransferase [Asanoa siamensis]|uniref:Aminoglycoside phosphotransferase n=1 Tax=Asanoa siamensis TaxID=926357 RepID=A0ABQ4CW58_9ACTN|nr:phosphotransferase [Asanoa siamensis]GIF75536.1 aminoglycoside phosphotransferase [Asanoa siamensis]
MAREFLRGDELRDLVAEQFGTARRLLDVRRLAGGSRKGVYRLRLDDGTSAVLYRWTDDEDYWPAPPVVPGDPFVNASGPALFAASHAALTAAGVRVPRLITTDGAVALLEDAGGTTLETLLERDPAAAAAPLAALGDAVRRMHTTFGPRYGKLEEIDHTAAQRPAQDVILDRALVHLDAAAARDDRMAAAREPIAAHARRLHGAVRPRHEFALIHAELGPDHVLVTADGEPVLIDIEGVSYFDVEWEHAFLQLRFGAAYPALGPVACDPARLAFYRYAQVLALVEGPLRIATTDFPQRRWMLDLADLNITKACREAAA